jgi:hypothetical protein
MYGLLLRSIQSYVRATHGAVLWSRVLRLAGQPADGFEPMLTYAPDVLDQVVAACAAELGRPADVILEDVGTFLVTAAGHHPLRRLLRFGGTSFEDFLQSLEELPERARLALQGVEFPRIAVEERMAGQYRLNFDCGIPAVFPVALGAVRAMADDYGALVLIEASRTGCAECAGGVLDVQVLETAHGAGRKFNLALEGSGLGR